MSLVNACQLSLVILVFLSMGACSHHKKSTMSSGKEDLNLEVQSYTLKNGLRLLVVEDSTLPIYSYYTFFKIGGRHEGPGTTGASHFLEHMMFKGAVKYGPGQFDSFIEKNGGSTNAYTSFDSTVYYQKMPKHTLSKLVDFEADRMVGLLLEPGSFENERNVVLEERKLRFENSPQGKLYHTSMKNIFEGTPYGGSVIGSVKDLKGLQREQVWEFFRKYYAPNNAIIVVSGDVDADDVYDLISEKYGEIPASESINSLREQKDDPSLYQFKGRYNREVKVHAPSPTPLFSISYKGEPLGTRKALAMDILASILGEGESSYLNQNFVRNSSPQLSSISVSNYNLKYNGIFFVSGELLKKTSLNRFKKKIYQELAKACQTAISERSLQKTKNKFLISYYRELQSNSGVAHFIGLREHLLDDFEFYKKELDVYQSVTMDEVKDVCLTVLNPKNSIFTSVWAKHPKS